MAGWYELMRFSWLVDEAALPDGSKLKTASSRSMPRGKGRVDSQNPTGKLKEALDATWTVIEPGVRGRLPNHTRRSQALIVVQPGSPAQPWHVDLDGDADYHTVLVPLTTEHEAGGTEFEDGLCYMPVRGRAYAFDGALVHRGGAHRGTKRRVCAAFVLTSCDATDDLNVVHV